MSLCHLGGSAAMAGFWRGLFGRFGGEAASAVDASASGRVAAVVDELKARGRPCLRLVPAEGGGSHLGGTAVTAGAWPRYDGRPLSLVAQLDLAEMRAAGGPDWLPEAGRLLVFYDLEYGGWGFDPKDAGSAVVRYEAGTAEGAAAPEDLPQDRRFKSCPVGFVADVSLPSEQRLDVDWKAFTRAETRALEAAVEALAPAEPRHQVGGYPTPVQGDGMELECQLASNGVYLGKGPPPAAKLKALGGGANDWRLLLQVDTDEAAGMMWGDTGCLYFWVREQDARAGDFSRIWAVLQCY